VDDAVAAKARELHEKGITPSDMAKIVGGLPLDARRTPVENESPSRL
jgi:hypothetical protein